MKNLNLRTARDGRGWTMDVLAKRSGISKGTISRIESGEIVNPSNDTVTKLEQALGLRRGTLIFGQAREERAS